MAGKGRQHPAVPAEVRAEDLFSAALGLEAPWRVTGVSFEGEPRRLDIQLAFATGAHFACPECGAQGLGVYDAADRTWRHLDFFQHQCHLHTRLPRVQCKACGVRTVSVPWARPGSGFTLLFEAMTLVFGKEMPMQALRRAVGEWDTRLWRVIQHHTTEARQREDYSSVHRVGVDETAARRGQHYVTTFVDLDRAKVLFATPGRDSSTLERFAEDLRAHGGDPAQITAMTMDMSAAFISGAEKHFPGAELTFDKFHVMQAAGAAVDEVRRQEQGSRPELKGTRYIWLRSDGTLTAAQRDSLALLKRAHLKTARAHALREALSWFWDAPPETAVPYLKWWYNWAIRSRLRPMVEMAGTVKRHWQGILNYIRSRSTNAVLEGVNSLVQAAKSRARGYRNVHRFISMVYLLAGKLEFRLPHWSAAPAFAHTK